MAPGGGTLVFRLGRTIRILSIPYQRLGGARGLTPVKSGGARRLTLVSKTGGGAEADPGIKEWGARRLTLVSKTGGGPEADPRIKDWGGPEADPWNYDDSRAEPGLTPPTGLEPYVA